MSKRLFSSKDMARVALIVYDMRLTPETIGWLFLTWIRVQGAISGSTKESNTWRHGLFQNTINQKFIDKQTEGEKALITEMNQRWVSGDILDLMFLGLDILTPGFLDIPKAVMEFIGA